MKNGSILFLSQPPSLFNACFGGIMATRTQKLGIEGIVIDGRLRDLQYIRSVQLPVDSPDVLFQAAILF